MKTATVREVRQNFGQLLAWINAGEEVTITLRSKAVARIVAPPPPPKKRKLRWPDFTAREKAIFGDKVYPGNLVLEERETYQW